MHDFFTVGERTPGDGQAVEVIRDYGSAVANPLHSSCGCRFGIERTRYVFGLFECDVCTTGHVTHWRPAEPMIAASIGDYPLLDRLVAE